MTVETAKYLGLFVTEARDHLAKLGAELVRLEKVSRDGGDGRDGVDELFRHAHSLKGMSGTMGLDGIAALAHRAEDLVDAFRRRAEAPGAEAVDVLLAAVDALSAMVEVAATGASPEPDSALLGRVADAAARARRDGAAAGRGAPASSGAAAGDVAAPPSRARRHVAITVEVAASCPVPSVRGFLVVKKLARLGGVVRASPSLQDLRGGRLPGGRLDLVVETDEPLAEVERALGQISDLASVAVREEDPVAPPPTAAAAAPREGRAAEGGRTVRVRVELLDSFLDAVGELILATARLREIGHATPEPFRPALDDGVDRLQATVKDLHDKVMAVRMTPLAVLTDRLPRAARDLARRTGKQVDVEVRGAEIEIDRAILDELADPVLHLLRNAVDHGIEAPHLRLLAGKPASGRVLVTARRERDRVLLEIADDGKGLDAERLRQAAVARGAVTEAAARALSDAEAHLLACVPGVSTAEAVTDVSGRGVGMDAVKRAVEGLGGALEVESGRGTGTRWVLRLPLTVAVQPVLLVSVAGEVVGLPISKVHGAAQVDVDGLDTSEGAPVLPYGGKLVPVRELSALLGFPAPKPNVLRSVVVAEGDGVRTGLAVDALLGQREAVLKPLSRPLDAVPGLSAVTVLGDGRPVFILDVQRLLAA